MVEAPSFAAGGGKMGALLREHDWSRTPLGPLATWPQTLRTTVGLVLHSVVPIVLLWGEDGIMIYNDAYSVFAGGRHPILFGSKVREGWPEVADFNDNVMKVGLAGGTLAYKDQELTLYRNGAPEQVWMNLDYSPAPDERGNPAGVIAIVVETTARVLAERRQAAERERQRAIFQQMPGFVGVLTGPDHVFEYVNDAYVAISGPRTFVGRSVREVFPELEGQGFYELLDRVYATGQPFRAQAMPIRLVAENEDRYIDLLYEPIRNDGREVTGIFVGGYDVTDRVRAEARRETLARLTDKLHDLTNPDDIAFTASEILGRALRVSRVGYGAIDPDAETLEVVRDWIGPGVETLAGVLPLRVYGSFIDSLKRGEFIAISDVEKDDRTINAADALKSRSARSFVNVPTLEHGRLVAVLFINDADVRAWSPEDLALIHEVAARTRVAVERSRNEAALRNLNATLQNRIAAALAEQATMEETLRQSQKMEAVGQLTGGLAHDFNNLLAGISGSLEIMQSRVRQGRVNDVERYTTAAQGAVKRAAALTHRLLAFSRRQTLEPKPTDVNQLVADMQDIIQRTVGPTIAFEFVGLSGLWPTLVDHSQLENSLLNLCLNARDAMPNGGQIIVETANKWLDARAARQHDMPEGQFMSLSVTDTGVGMPPDVAARAFEPFFTTKPTGEGTGLGLSMVYGFARQSGGQVRIYSEVGEGTTVCIYLPRFYGELARDDEPAKAANMSPSSNSETVLVVDDEPTVRMLISDILEELGYVAIEAADSVAGLKVLQSDARIDLLVTDVGLPGGMNGRQMADAARVTRPDLKVLFITGYAENSVLGNGRLAPGMAVMTKPFPVEMMASRIKQMIEL
jgi:signal transduction histidine kinase/PAS domain-containing protein